MVMLMKTNKRSQKVFALSFILCIASFLLTVLTAFDYGIKQNKKIREAKNDAKQEAVRAATEIEDQLRKLKDTGLLPMICLQEG